jgi:L-rhamnose-H+ transport protein
MDTLLGVLLVTLAGLGTGTIAWPMKLIRRQRFEHYWFISMFVSLVLVPWLVVVCCVPRPMEVYAEVGWRPILLCNLFSIGWGIANVLYGVCVLRIGAALTGAVLSGLGVAAGVMLPMVLKGSGVFSQAPDLTSKPGLVILSGVVVILAGVVLSTLAGFGRDRLLRKDSQNDSVAKRTSGSFLTGLAMAVAAGLLSAGIALGFVYAQDPIVAAVRSRGGTAIPANMAVWAIGLIGGAAINIGYPAWLMTKRRSWGMLFVSARDAALALALGLQLILAVALMGKGMLLLGVAGAAIGFGIQQALQLLGNQAVGFLSGEWRGIGGRPLQQMHVAILVLLAAVAVLAVGQALVP